MSIIKRITQIITPPPKKRPKTPQPSSSLELHREFGPELRRHLKALLLAHRSNEPAARKAVNDLKSIAQKSGFYETGTHMMMEVESILRNPKSPAPTTPERVYLLAGNFIFQHVVQFIDSIGTDEDSFGPNAFRLIVTDLIECLLHSENVRRGVEIPVLCIDMLLVKAVDRFECRGVYLGCAAQTVSAMEELIEEKYRHDSVALRKSDPETAGRRSPFSIIDKSTLQYVTEFREHFEWLQTGFSQSVHREEDEPTATNVELLLELENIALNAGYQAFAGWLAERCAINLESTDVERSRAFILHAAERYEAQGDKEMGVLFTKLAKARYTKAQELYDKAGNETHVRAVALKLEQAAALKGLPKSR